MTNNNSVLTKTIRTSIKHLEWFDAPLGIQEVEMVCDELTSVCPVTGQPDYYDLIIKYEPDKRCIESKSLKLFLWGFREQGLFCEKMSVMIAQEVMETINPYCVSVTLRQKSRGGISVISTTDMIREEGE